MKNAGGDSFNEYLLTPHHFDVQFVCVFQSDRTYHQKNIGSSTCTLYPLSILPLQPGITITSNLKRG